jgi:hypothetical protein
MADTVSTPVSSDDIAREALLNGETAKRLLIRESTPAGHATKRYSIILDQGWCERGIASGMYDHDAKGIAHALAHTLNCGVVEPVEWEQEADGA